MIWLKKAICARTLIMTFRLSNVPAQIAFFGLILFHTCLVIRCIYSLDGSDWGMALVGADMPRRSHSAVDRGIGPSISKDSPSVVADVMQQNHTMRSPNALIKQQTKGAGKWSFLVRALRFPLNQRKCI